MVQNFLVLNI